MAGLHNRLYFPAFCELPQVDEWDANYYSETAQGLLVPSRTWCFVGEIVSDALSQLPVLGHRVEVRDVFGDTKSVLFYPENGTFDFSLLRTGNTLFIRYAQRCCFSDLMTEAIKIEDLDFVKVIETNLDTLLYMSDVYFGQHGTCLCCRRDITQLGGAAIRCVQCGTATYCSSECRSVHDAQHASFCHCCLELGEVFNIDFERWTNFVPFRQ